MEQNRDNTNRGGQPGGSGNEYGRNKAEQGFEGMNYEQRREPYKSDRQQKLANKNGQGRNGRSDGEAGDRSPV